MSHRLPATLKCSVCPGSLCPISSRFSQGVKGLWCAAVLCRSHLSSSACLCAAAWCTLLSLRPTPNILVSKCKTVVVCIFLYFFCTSWRIAENISFAVWTQWLGWSYEWQDAKCLYVWKQMEGIHAACPSPLPYMETGCPFLPVAPFQKENILKTQHLYDILLYYFSSYFSSDVKIIHEHVFCFNDCWSSFRCLEANWFIRCL